MRAFEPFNKKYKWNHPEDMQIIINYLEATGKINIEKQFLEDLYYDYSDSVACGWRCVDPQSLEEFAEYLTHVELSSGGYKYIRTVSYYDDEED